MIAVHDDIIEMHTSTTSYILGTRHGLLECLHYGPRIKVENPLPLFNKNLAGYGGDILRDGRQPALSSLCLELSPNQRGDYRKNSLLVKLPNGGYTTDFSYSIAQVQKDTAAPAGAMPQAHDGDMVLSVSFTEQSGLSVELFYTLFYKADVITKKMRITNHCEGTVTVERAFSNQLDFPRSDFDLYNLTGAWSRECEFSKRPLAPETLGFGNGTGSSGNRCNPFFMLAAKDATEMQGEVYGFNLVYSGSHEGSVEVDGHGRTRVLHGIWSDGFAWPLAPGESFVTPEAVLTFSNAGKNGMSHNMHSFVQNHILPKQWARAPRPVLVNNWEGTYFRFNESKLLKMARVAAKVGIELFVLDDGWFGERNNDRAGLGDYAVNRKKLPSGLEGLAAKINRLGMDFGLWFEPEMANADSDLYRAHPDWIVQTPGYEAATGRAQYVLDLCRPEVREYIIRSVNGILDTVNISYIKWDMNRHVSDNYSPALQEQGEFHHRFTLGLYQVFEGICKAHPDVLFEGCSSGGNRFDLGVLCYMPQIWTSDNTDAVQRQRIQTGTSYGYPLCTMGCHVSAVPNHQTLRHTPLETRFNTAAFGLLGYELDMAHLDGRGQADIESQIAYYKLHRTLFQYGTFWRLKSPFEETGCRWMVVSSNRDEAVLGDFAHLLEPNAAKPPVRLCGLAPNDLYNIQVRRQKLSIDTFGGLVNFILPVHLRPEGKILSAANKAWRLPTEDEAYLAYGSLLCGAGLNLVQDFSGAGYHQDMRFMTDFASRIYYINRVDGQLPNTCPEQQ